MYTLNPCRLYEGAICIVLAAGFSKVEQASDLLVLF